MYNEINVKRTDSETLKKEALEDTDNNVLEVQEKLDSDLPDIKKTLPAFARLAELSSKKRNLSNS